MLDMPSFPRKEPEFSQFLIREYFRFGSVDEVLRRHHFDLPVSYATYQRLLNNYGVIKKAGPNNRLSETLAFFEDFVKDKTNLEDIYKKMPVPFRTSLKTIYRIYSYMRRGLTRRVGVALVVSPYNNPKKILLARDVSIPSLTLGKTYGCLSLPMGYTRKRDSRKIGIIRTLQYEVFTEMVIKGNFPFAVAGEKLEPFLYLDIADVRVAVYNISLPKELSLVSLFSSFKMKDYKFYFIEEILSANLRLRAGVKESVSSYLKYLCLLEKNLVVNPFQEVSNVNEKTSLVSV